jgi:release factor glutamine methyltransferase
LLVVTVLEVIQRSTEFLAKRGVDSPRLQVELLLAHSLKVPRLRLYLDFERPLTEGELDTVRLLVKRRGAREPLQHLVGSTSFCGFEISVTPDVLIPRPETENLAERAWNFLNDRLAAGSKEVTALDFGTGSGCLAVALARHVRRARIHALDVSAAALAVARQNASRHGVEDCIEFLESDGFLGVPQDLRFDLIIANPPYIPSAEIERLAPEVRDHDPRLALDGGPDGLRAFRLLAAQSTGFQLARGQLMCEFGDGQAQAVQSVFQEQGWKTEAVAADLSGRERILVVSRPES